MPEDTPRNICQNLSLIFYFNFPAPFVYHLFYIKCKLRTVYLLSNRNLHKLFNRISVLQMDWIFMDLLLCIKMHHLGMMTIFRYAHSYISSLWTFCFPIVQSCKNFAPCLVKSWSLFIKLFESQPCRCRFSFLSQVVVFLPSTQMHALIPYNITTWMKIRICSCTLFIVLGEKYAIIHSNDD